MWSSKEVIAVVIVVIIILAAVAYMKCWLNKILPPKWQKNCAPQSSKSGFVGAFGRTPAMQHCLAYPDPNGMKHWTTFNRCTWV